MQPKVPNLTVQPNLNGIPLINKNANQNRTPTHKSVLVLKIEVGFECAFLIFSSAIQRTDITRVLSPKAPLTTEWKPDLLGGVVVIKGQFTDGSPMMAIPNFARMNRAAAPPPAAPGQRPAARPPASIVGSPKVDTKGGRIAGAPG
jgi:hypothetical protein